MQIHKDLLRHEKRWIDRLLKANEVLNTNNNVLKAKNKWLESKLLATLNEHEPADREIRDWYMERKNNE